MKPILLAAAAALLVAHRGYAQAPTGITTPVAHRSSALVGANVVHRSETIGKVSEFIINDSGCIDYLVVSYGSGFLPVPWSAAQVNYELRGVTFRNANLSQAQLQGLVFTAWPDFTDAAVVQRLRDVWGAPAVPNTTPAPATRDGARPAGPNVLLRTPPAVSPPGLNPGDGQPRPRDSALPAPGGPGTPGVGPGPTPSAPASPVVPSPGTGAPGPVRPR